MEENKELNTAPQQENNAPQEESIADRVRIISPTKLVMKRFFRSKLSVIGLVLFLSLFLFSFIGPLFVGWAEEEVDMSGGQPFTPSLKLSLWIPKAIPIRSTRWRCSIRRQIFTPPP